MLPIAATPVDRGTASPARLRRVRRATSGPSAARRLFAAAGLLVALVLLLGACGGVDEETARGSDLLDEGRFEEAVAAFSEEIERDDEDALAYVRRGTAYHDLGRFEEALADYDRAIELDPSAMLPYANRALAHRALGDYQLAREDFETALALTSDPQVRAQIEALIESLGASP